MYNIAIILVILHRLKNSIGILSFRHKEVGLLVKRQRQCAVVAC